MPLKKNESLEEVRLHLSEAQAEYRKATAAAKRAHEIFKDAPFADGHHAVQLALEQQARSIQRVSEMLRKYSDRVLQRQDAINQEQSGAPTTNSEGR
jgi:DNA-binding ferritin-like protein